MLPQRAESSLRNLQGLQGLPLYGRQANGSIRKLRGMRCVQRVLPKYLQPVHQLYVLSVLQVLQVLHAVIQSSGCGTMGVGAVMWGLVCF